MEKVAEIFNVIDRLNDKYVSVWEDVCNIEIPTNDKAGMDKVGEYFINLAKKQGWAI